MPNLVSVHSADVVIPGVYFYFHLFLFYFFTSLFTYPDRIFRRKMPLMTQKDAFPIILVPICGSIMYVCICIRHEAHMNRRNRQTERQTYR